MMTYKVIFVVVRLAIAVILPAIAICDPFRLLSQIHTSCALNLR